MMAANVLFVTHSSSLVTPSGNAPRHKCLGSMFLFTNGMLVYPWTNCREGEEMTDHHSCLFAHDTNLKYVLGYSKLCLKLLD